MLEILSEIWPRVQQDLRARAGESAFRAWLEDLRPLALERGVCYVEAKNRLVTERVERLFQPLIEESLSSEVGTRITASIVSAAESLVPDETEVGPARPIVDGSNKTAFLVLKSLLEEKELPGKLFFFYGPPGAGKSFLLRWWSQHCKGKPRQFTGQGLVKAFQACLRDRRLDDLRRELREDRPLVIDEVHRIGGYHRLQRELLAALQSRSESDAPVLLASRWHPREAWNLIEELGPYFMSGFVTRVDYPGPEARLRYLRALEGSPSRNGRAGDIETLAQRVRGSYIDLRRAWMVQHEVSTRPARHLRLIDPRSVFDRLLALVAQRLDADAEEVVGKSQGRRVSFARQVLSYLCVHEGLSRAEVGRFLGGRSRAAVSYATKTIERRMAESADVRSQVEELL